MQLPLVIMVLSLLVRRGSTFSAAQLFGFRRIMDSRIHSLIRPSCTCQDHISSVAQHRSFSLYSSSRSSGSSKKAKATSSSKSNKPSKKSGPSKPSSAPASPQKLRGPTIIEDKDPEVIFSKLLKEHKKNKAPKRIIQILDESIEVWRKERSGIREEALPGDSSDNLNAVMHTPIGTGVMSGGISGTIMMTRSVAAMRTLLRMNCSEMLPDVFQYWEEPAAWDTRTGLETDHTSDKTDHTSNNTTNSTTIVGTTIAVVKMYSKIGKLDLVERAASIVGISIGKYSACTDSANTPLYKAISSAATASPCPVNINILSEMCFGFVRIGAYPKALSCLETISQLQDQILNESSGPIPFESIALTAEQSRKLLRAFIEHTSLVSIRQALALLIAISNNDRWTRKIPSSQTSGSSASSTATITTSPSITTNYIDNDHAHLQLITNTFMKNVEFVTGAVSMQTLPIEEDGCHEVAFIGRSNVGKSSLINMVCNRKGLAYTSKTPGKTSEFNYFDARAGRVGVSGEQHRFYLVDLPGVGYAEKSRDLRSSWTNLLKAYVGNRKNLRAVFHLVDSRHGLLSADEECLELLRTLPSNVEYVLVLTKVDKLRGQAMNRAQLATSAGGSGFDMIDEIYRQVAMRTPRVVQLVHTSSETKHGSAQFWSTLLDALAREVPVDEIETADIDIDTEAHTVGAGDASDRAVEIVSNNGVGSDIDIDTGTIHKHSRTNDGVYYS